MYIFCWISVFVSFGKIIRSGIAGLYDACEKEMAAHSSILAWRIPWTEKPGGLQSMRLQESDMTEQLAFTHSLMMHVCVSAKSLQLDSLWLSGAHQAPVSMDSPGKNTGVGCPCLSTGDLSHPGIELMSPMSPALRGRLLTTSSTWEVQIMW